MVLKLHALPASAPCRSVKLTAAAVGVELEIVETSLANGDHLTPEFLKLNPQHTIPTLDDEGFGLWESRTIMRYLVNKYGKEDDSLYPRDPKTRAVVDRLLDFDLGTLYNRFGAYVYPQWFAKQPACPEAEKKMLEGFAFLDTFLEGVTYLAGDKITLADFTCIATVSTALAVDIDLSAYTNITRWVKLVSETAVDYEKANGEGALKMRALAGLEPR